MKRVRDSETLVQEQHELKRPSSSILGISRSIAACQRCRIKKTKCDQKFPRCGRCEKAKVECVGLDSATGRQVPRSYIVHLEDRVAMLEKKLRKRGVDPDLTEGDLSNDIELTQQQEALINNNNNNNNSSTGAGIIDAGEQRVKAASSLSMADPSASKHHNNKKVGEPSSSSTMMENVSNATTESSSKAPLSYLGGSSLGISFAKLMFTAVKFQQQDNKSTTSGTTPNSGNIKYQIMDPSMSSKTAIGTIPALLPPKDQAQRFLEIYFAQSNSQLPIFHREEFIKAYFEPIYGSLGSNVSLASNYSSINREVLNSNIQENQTWFWKYKEQMESILSEAIAENKENPDPIKIANSIVVPLKYHRPLYFLNIVFAISSSVHHLQYASQISEGFRTSALKFIESVYSSPDRLEALQSILLLTLYSIMRPAVPGVWYVLGSALRLVVDLGLHTEKSVASRSESSDSFTLDMKRRLFWCTYSLDRQVCFYLGRPFGISEESINVPFPSELDDALIVRNDDSIPDYSTRSSSMPSYKAVSISMFKMRLLQSEVQRILYENAELPRKFSSLIDWKIDCDKRLDHWKMSSPKTQRRMNCEFNLAFFNLNYNQTKLALHGLSPKNLRLTVSDYFIVNDASKEVIRSYSNLLNNRSINYTWVAVHNLFMAGTSYLYSIYHCEEVAQKTSLQEMQWFTSSCSKILNSLMDRCDAAIHCKDTFEILSAVVIKLKYNVDITTGVSRAVPTMANGNGEIVTGFEIPSASKIADQQPGRHVTEHLEKLVETLPGAVARGNDIVPKTEFNDQSPIMQAQDKFNYQQQYDNFFRANPPQTQPFPQQHSENAQSVQFQPFTEDQRGPDQSQANNYNESFDVNTSNWGSNYDLDKFFEELDQMGSFSPNSTRSSSADNINSHSNNKNKERQNVNFVNPSRQSGYNTYPSNSPSHSSSSYRTLSSENSPHEQDSRAGNIPTPVNNNGNNQLYADPNINTGTAASVPNPRTRKPGQLPSTRDGQQIYKMIYQVPAESIWEQFFSTPVGYNNIEFNSSFNNGNGDRD